MLSTLITRYIRDQYPIVQPTGGTVQRVKLNLMQLSRTAYPLPVTMNEAMLRYLRGVYPPPLPEVQLVTAGTPGTFYPATAPVPTQAALMTMVPPSVWVSPRTTWPVSNYVVTSNAVQMSWTGFGWAVKP
jgi:hypothetical protein